MCLSDACIRHDIEVANRGTADELLSLVMAAMGSGPAPSTGVPLTRENLFAAIYIFPVLIVLTGILANVAPLCCRNPRWQKCCPSCWTGSL